MAAVPTSIELMTLEAFRALPNADELELVQGEAVPVAENDLEHGYMEALIVTALSNFVGEHRLGVALGSSTRFHVRVTNKAGRVVDSYRQADASVILGKTAAEVFRLHPYHGAPDVAVEVVSPSDDLEEALGKASMWVQHGAKLAWVISSQRLVFVYRPGRDKPELLGMQDTLDGGEVLPGFTCPVQALFAEA